MILHITTYVQSDKGSNRELITKIEKDRNISLSTEFKDAFSYINYEVPLVYEFDTEKMTAKLIEACGIPVTGPVKSL